MAISSLIEKTLKIKLCIRNDRRVFRVGNLNYSIILFRSLIRLLYIIKGFCFLIILNMILIRTSSSIKSIISTILLIAFLVLLCLTRLCFWSFMHLNLIDDLLVLDFTLKYTIVPRYLLPIIYLMLCKYFLQNWILQVLLIKIVLER
jgi:hypothetical protein